MGVFDLFDFSWKKEFEELLSSNKDAVECYVKKKYKVYEDMGHADKSMFQDYFKTYENVFLPLTTYIEPIESLSKKAKKFLIQRKSEIIRLHRTYNKYSSPQKRVISLYERFQKNGVFDMAFGDFLGDNYDIHSLNEEQISFILENHLLPSMYATRIRDEKIKKQDELRERYIERKISLFIKKQQLKLPGIIHLQKNHSELTAKLKYQVDHVSKEFHPNGIFSRVCRFLFDDFENIDSLNDNQYIYILANRSEFEKEKEFFDLAQKEGVKEHEYLLFLKNKNLTENHEGVLFCLIHFEDILPFIEALEQDAMLKLWIDTQKIMNEKSKELAAYFLPKFWCRNLRMYIEHTNEKGEAIRKILPFNLYSLNDYTKEIPTLEEKKKPYAYVFYNNTKAQNALKGTIAHEANTMTDIGSFVFNLMTQMATGGIVVVLGSSGFGNPVDYNSFHFCLLKKKLDKGNIQCVNVKDLNNDNIKKNIVIVEMVSEVERLRYTCKNISKLYPGSNIIYVTLYNELTKNQLNALKER